MVPYGAFRHGNSGIMEMAYATLASILEPYGTAVYAVNIDSLTAEEASATAEEIWLGLDPYRLDLKSGKLLLDFDRISRLIQGQIESTPPPQEGTDNADR
jgi:hypothetical protein